MTRKVQDEDDRTSGPAPPSGPGTVNAFVRRLPRRGPACRAPDPRRHPQPRADRINVRPPGHGRRPPQPPRSGQAVRVGVTSAGPSRTRRPGSRPSCCFWSSTSSTSTPRAKGPARSRRFCSTSPNGVASSASSLSGPSRRPARWSGGSSPTPRSGSSAGSTPPRPPRGVRVPSGGAAPARHDPQTGHDVAAQPELPVPLVLEFPFPAWATRASEAGMAPDGVDGPADPFEDLFRNLPGSVPALSYDRGR